MRRHHLSRAAVYVYTALTALVMHPGAASAEEPLGGEFQINTFTPGHQGAPSSVGMDAAGNFVVVWQSNGQVDGIDIFGQRFDADGNPVGAEFQVNTFTAGDQWRPDIAVNRAGDFVVVWLSSIQDGGEQGVYAQRYHPDGTPNGGEFRVNDDWPGDVSDFSADVAMAGDGSFLGVWDEDGRDAEGLGVFGQLFASDGAPVGGAFRVSEQSVGHQRLPKAAADGNSFAVAWEAFDQPGDTDCQGSYMRVFNLDGSPRSGDVLVNQTTTFCQWEPDLAVNETADRIVVAWATEHNGEAGVWNDVAARVYDLDGNPVGDEFLANVTGADNNAPSIWGDQQFRPLIGIADDGRFAIIWHDNANDEHDNDGSSGVYGRGFWANGMGTCGDYLINETIPGGQIPFGFALNPGGSRQVAIWGAGNGQDGSGFGVFGRRYGQIVPDLPLPMGCFAANCLKVNLGSGAGDGKITAQGSLAPFVCTELDPEGVVHPPITPDSQVELRLDGVLMFSQPFSAFQQGKGESYKFRGSAGGMQLNFDRASWKFVDRRSNVGLGAGVDPSDGIEVELRIGDQAGVELLQVDYNEGRGLAQACRKGGAKVVCE